MSKSRSWPITAVAWSILGERDCSVQRRHQKVLEETPSPAVDDALRAALGSAATRLAAAVGYASAGTCEFLVADDGSWSFLEMNTRLQVEHPVTEMVTGRDLVADQLAIAAGATLSELGLEGDEPPPDGHAIEVRLYAEDAEAGFLPATGRVEALRWPASDSIRVDAGIELGTIVGARFDPLLAKIIAHAPDRATALARLAMALDEILVLGVVTNLRFLRWLVRQSWLVEGEARVDSLDATWAPIVGSAVPDDAWATAAAALARRPDERADDPWSDGWRLGGWGVVTLLAEDGEVRRISISPGMAVDDRGVVIGVDGGAFVDVDGRSVGFRSAPPPDVDRAARDARAHHDAGTARLEAPMPGRVIGVATRVGGRVDTGDPVVTLEAMKMEHVIRSPIEGVVESVEVRIGDQVDRGRLLAVVEP